MGLKLLSLLTLGGHSKKLVVGTVDFCVVPRL